MLRLHRLLESDDVIMSHDSSAYQLDGDFLLRVDMRRWKRTVLKTPKQLRRDSKTGVLT